MRKTKILELLINIPERCINLKNVQIVSIKKNFDELMVPVDHPSRKKSESYYLTEELMLRPHTSVHQIDTIK